MRFSRNRGPGLWAMAAVLAVSAPSPSLQADPEPAPSAGVTVITKEQLGLYRPRSRADLAKAAQVIVEQTNEFRKEEGLSTLTRSEQLQKTAHNFALYMATSNRYGHEADGKTPSQRAEEQGYEICLISENIAMQFRSNGFSTGLIARTLVNGWKASPPHRANMVNPGVTETGVAIAQSPETGAYFAVQLFGRPRSQAIHFEIRNQTSRSATYRIGAQSYPLQPRFIMTHMLCTPEKITLLNEQGEPGEEFELADKDILTVDVVSGKLTLQREVLDQD